MSGVGRILSSRAERHHIDVTKLSSAQRQEPRHLIAERRQVDRLGHVAVDAFEVHLVVQRRVDVRGYGHDSDRPAQETLPEHMEHLNAVVERHVNVENHEIELSTGSKVQSAIAVACSGDVVSLGFQELLKKIQVRRIVFGDEDLRLAHRTDDSASARNPRIRSPSVLVSIGLEMYPMQPAAIACSRSVAMAWAVNATIGIGAVAGSALSWRVSDRPSCPGSCTSIRIRSGARMLNRSRTSSAEPAESTRK